MQRNLVAGMLLVALMLTGCGSNEIESLAGATPEATFDTMKSAAAKQDWVGFASCITTDSKDDLIGLIYMIVDSSQEESDPADKAEAAKMKTPKEILAKHGLDVSKGLAIVPGGNPKDAFKKVLGGVKNKTACAGELIAWAESDADFKKSGNSPGDIVNFTLSAVKVEGDTALGKRTMKQNGKDVIKDTKFKKLDEKWYVDMSR